MALDAWRRAELEEVQKQLQDMVSGKTGVPVTRPMVLFICSWVLPGVRAALAPTQAERPTTTWWPPKETP